MGVVLENALVPVDPRDPRQTFACELVVREDSALGLKAAEFIKERLIEANIRILRERRVGVFQQQRASLKQLPRNESRPVRLEPTVLPVSLAKCLLCFSRVDFHGSISEEPAREERGFVESLGPPETPAP